MEFPDDFTTLPRDVLSTDYVLLEKYRATVAQLAAYLTPGGGQTLVAWNGTDVTQFTSTGDIGTPTSPAIAFVSQTTKGADALRLSLGNGTGAGEGRIYWFATTADFQSMRIRFQVYIDVANPIQPGEDLGLAVVVGGTQTTGNNIAFTLFVDDAGAPTISNSVSSAYNTLDTSILIDSIATAGTGAWQVDITLTGRLTDTGTYTPNGAPAYIADISVAGITGVEGYHALCAASSTDWNVAVGALDTNRIGIGVITTSGVTATTGLLISGITVESA